jgi:hypothetical protein
MMWDYQTIPPCFVFLEQRRRAQKHPFLGSAKFGNSHLQIHRFREVAPAGFLGRLDRRNVFGNQVNIEHHFYKDLPS